LRKKIRLGLVILVFINFLIIPNYLAINATCAPLEIDPEITSAPIIDGKINDTIDEWINSTKKSIKLDDLPIDLWVLQNDTNLYISVQLELEEHSLTEFIGIVISESDATDNESFTDARIIEFSNITGNQYIYKDYNIVNGTYNNDTISHGNGSASLREQVSIYEFKIPINNTYAEDSIEDVFLEDDETYAFKVIFGFNPSYPDEILKSNTVLINIQEIEQDTEEDNLEQILSIVSIILFSSLSGVIALYGIKIYQLSKKI
jgi:hypothetical protein